MDTAGAGRPLPWNKFIEGSPFDRNRWARSTMPANLEDPDQLGQDDGRAL
jgi:hypothetical protein